MLGGSPWAMWKLAERSSPIAKVVNAALTPLNAKPAATPGDWLARPGGHAARS
jgi:hypothetical protein